MRFHFVFIRVYHSLQPIQVSIRFISRKALFRYVKSSRTENPWRSQKAFPA